MKKQYVVFAGILALSLAVSGCGKTKKVDTPKVEVTATPAPSPTPATKEGELVTMQKSEASDISNVIGEKTATASKVIIVNNTGDEISAIYVRGTIDDDEEWGNELVQGKFVLRNGEKALYYFDPAAKDANGNTPSTYDIRITYTNEELSECYFRKLPLKTISQVTLCMDDSGDYSIPYAKYLTGTGKTETSTLNEVKQRLGLLDDEDDEEPEEQQNQAPTPTTAPAPTEAPGNEPEPTQEPAPAEDPNNDENIKAAEGCIGQPLESLIATCGEPIGSDYQEEPETGETGYHYYENFTVSTTVDDDGNEVVAGVW